MATDKNVNDLFKKAMSLDDKVDAAKAALESAIEVRSNAVKALYEANGNENGPFSFKGKLYTIRHRAPKDDEGEPKKDANGKAVPETWFFVTIGGQELTTIE